MNTLRTENLCLRPYTASDLDNLLSLRSEQKVWTYSSSQPDDNRENAENHLNSLLEKYKHDEYAPFALFTKEGTYVGEAGAYHGSKESRRVNIGYNLLPNFWGNGYATEITKEIINWFLAESDVQRIEATVLEANTASVRVLEKANMQLEGVLRKFTVISGVSHNLCIYSIIK